MALATFKFNSGITYNQTKKYRKKTKNRVAQMCSGILDN
jgi:hypothetical protein